MNPEKRHSAFSWPLFGVVLAWGYNFIAIKQLYHAFEPSGLALGRFLVMQLAVVVICKLRRMPLCYPDLKESIRLLLLGFFSMGIYTVLFFEGMKLILPSQSAILLATSPLWVLFIDVILKHEKFRFAALIGVALSIVGVGMVVGPAHAAGTNELLGSILILVSAFCWAATVVYSRHRTKERDPLLVLTLSMPGGLLVLIPYGYQSLVSTHWTTLTAFDWAQFAHVSFLAGAYGFFAFFDGVKKVGASQAMLYQFGVPVMASLFAAILLHTPPTAWQIAGMIVVLTGVAIAKKPRPVAETAVA
ncbi:MAG: DMT family transporter [Armatimonadetes bacterium]|nr:DMT family transporter [Armatimonadota bacterium]